MKNELDTEVTKLAEVVERLGINETITLHLEPAFRSQSMALAVKLALEGRLRAGGTAVRSIEVAGDDALQVST